MLFRWPPFGLDWFLFGNGYGMGSPYFDDTFYWLKDMSCHDRGKARGQMYRWGGGLGSQLNSCEWRAPRPQERRLLFGHQFQPFYVTRHGLRVDVSWELVGGVRDVEHVNELKNKLQNWNGHQ